MGFFISIRFYFTNYKLGIIIKIQQSCYFTLAIIKITILMSSMVYVVRLLWGGAPFWQRPHGKSH